MAKILDEYDFSAPSNLSSERRFYPWKLWFDGQIWQIFSGVDFATTPLMMERVIRGTAVRKGFSVKIRHEVSSDSIILQATPKP